MAGYSMALGTLQLPFLAPPKKTFSQPSAFRRGRNTSNSTNCSTFPLQSPPLPRRRGSASASSSRRSPGPRRPSPRPPPPGSRRPTAALPANRRSPACGSSGWSRCRSPRSRAAAAASTKSMAVSSRLQRLECYLMEVLVCRFLSLSTDRNHLSLMGN